MTYKLTKKDLKPKSKVKTKTKIVYRTRREKQDNVMPFVGGMLVGGALVSMSQHHED